MSQFKKKKMETQILLPQSNWLGKINLLKSKEKII